MGPKSPTVGKPAIINLGAEGASLCGGSICEKAGQLTPEIRTQRGDLGSREYDE